MNNMEVTVKPTSLRSASGDLKGIAANVNRAARTIRMVSDNLDISSSVYMNISGKLKNYSNGIEAIGNKTKRAGEAGIKIAYLYEDADRDLAKSETLAGKVAWGAGMALLGTLGMEIDITRSVIEGNYGKAGGTVIKLVGKVVSPSKDIRTKWGNPLKNPDKVFTGALKDKLTSKTAWAAAIVENSWDNYKEHGGVNTRFIEETGVESAIDVGESALLYAGASVAVGAAAVALGVSAPAWAVGAAAGAVAIGAGIAVDAGLDWIATKITGDPEASWKEGVSDFICDTGEAIAKGAEKVVDDFVNGVKDLGSRIKWGIFNFGGSW